MRVVGTAAYLGGVWAVPEAFCWAWGALREYTTQYFVGPDEAVHYTRATFSLHAGARNMLAKEMVGDWLWMTDTDHTFEPDALAKMVMLMQRFQVPVLSGIYRHKVLPHHPMLWLWSEAEAGFVPLLEYDPTCEVFQIDAAGAGCLLLHASVFARLSERFPQEEPFEHRGHYGEDMSFFLRCREAGIPVYATPCVDTVHLMPHGVTEVDYVPDWLHSEEVTLRAGR
jgi:hypothetical protein